MRMEDREAIKYIAINLDIVSRIAGVAFVKVHDKEEIMIALDAISDFLHELYSEDEELVGSLISKYKSAFLELKEDLDTGENKDRHSV